MISEQRKLTKAGKEMRIIPKNFFNANIISRNLTAYNALKTNTINCSTQADNRKLLKGGLQRYPAFSLDKTLSKFLKTCEPFLSTFELSEAKLETINFKNGIGGILQKHLENIASKEDNWLADRWLQAAYLSYREPVVVFSNPGMTFPTQVFKSDDEYLNYTSKVIYGALKFKELIDNNLIPTMKIKNFPLDNSQFEKVFGTCRIPEPKIDKMMYNPNSKHIVIIHKNNFYKMPVYGPDNTIACPNEIIYPQLCKIISENKEPGPPIGLLSGDSRDNWAEAYEILIKKNESVLNDIHTALFTVSLDEEVPFKMHDLAVVAEQLIHGGGTKHNSKNRWFDKTIQIIVNRCGISGVCYEHSPAEGVAIAMMADFITNSIKDTNILKGSTKDKVPPYSQLDFEISNDLEPYFEKAANKINSLASDLEIRVLHFKKYGKEFPKLNKLSPDSFIQIAIQLAFYMIHKEPGAHYESAHLRIFNNGRTEAIRSCSSESIEFAKSMIESNYTDEQRVQLLREAVKAHNDYAVNAVMGTGVDRHLLGLKLMAIENNLQIPEFFNSKAVVKSSTYQLSTSQVPSANVSFMGYGPLTHDGYGCCYNPRNSDMIFAISSWSSNKKTSSELFAKSLYNALKNMENLLQNSSNLPQSKL